MVQSQSYSILRVTPLPFSNNVQSTANDIDKENESQQPRYETIGGIFCDTKYVWTANGPNLMIANSTTGVKVAAWCFGLIVKDFSTKIVCVNELPRPSGKLPLLIIGLNSTVVNGIICIFDITGSRILRTLHIDNLLTSFHVINASYDQCPLPGPLRAFDGTLAVGTVGGSVLLLDLCRQTCDEVLVGYGLADIRDEVTSCAVKTLFLSDVHSLEEHKQLAIENGEHLSIDLNATRGAANHHFTLKGPKGEDRVHVNRVEVVVSCLHYCPQLGSLLVGYNFGAWQLWDLINLKLVYTSQVLKDNIPASHFAIQEPCDDPRAFCYVWVIYSNTELHHRGFPLGVLYALNYDTKEFHEGYGVLYQDLLSCAARFQMDLAPSGEVDGNGVQQGGRCLQLQAVNKVMSKGGSLQEHQEETFSLCLIVWDVWSLRSNRNITKTYMKLFDLNQWYKEQMPSRPQLKECGTYMMHVCLSDVMQNIESTSCLDVQLDVNSLSKFNGSQKLEEHYYPSSLAFQLCSLTESDITFVHNKGSQRTLLSRLESEGSMVLLNPNEIFHQSITLGLHPLFVDVPNILNTTLDEQRELLLNIALEQQLLCWLTKCISTCTNSIHAETGVTLQFILSWAWQRAQVLKYNADLLSAPLFDYSSLRLDANTHNSLSDCAKQLKTLSTIFEYILCKFSRFVLHYDITKQQSESVKIVSLHLEVLLWLLNVGLLPECPISYYPRVDEFNRISAPYPVDTLIKYYNERRAELLKFNKEQFAINDSLLFIDNLIEMECGAYTLREQWESDGGTGLYPPPSLQALLRTYLVKGVKTSYKHCIIVYVFLDLAMTLDQNRYKPIITNLIKFPAVFQLSPSVIKITQAFWQLDHGDFATAMEQLLDPLVSTDDLKVWHHRVAFKALLAQKQFNFALTYLQVKQPPINDVQDLSTILSLFISNNMLDEAFRVQRQYKNYKNEEQLLRHFFQECDKIKEIGSVLYLPLTATEEKVFLKYLDGVNHPKKEDLKIFYYLQRSQYLDAFETNNHQHSIRLDSKGLKGQESTGFLGITVKELAESLPAVSKSLMSMVQKEKNTLWKEVKRPQPFSVFIHNSAEQAKYKSTIIHAVLSKAKETWTHPILDGSLKNVQFNSTITEQTPFLNTPVAGPVEPRMATPVIFPKITELQDLLNEDGPTPPKRFKLSPRSPLTLTHKDKSVYMDLNSDKSVRLDTPIIKRKYVRKSMVSQEKGDVGTPHGILKVNETLATSISPKRAGTEIYTRRSTDSPSGIRETTTSIGPLRPKRSFGCTPRKPIDRVSRLGVRFNMTKASSETSLASTASGPDFEVIEDQALVHSSMEGLENSMSFKMNNSDQSKNNSVSTDEVYYSPDTSLKSNTDSKSNELQSILEVDESKVLNQQVSENATDLQVIEEGTSAEHLITTPRKTTWQIKNSFHVNMDEITISPETPRGRRSYKGILSQSHIRSSPRLRKVIPTESELPTVENPLQDTTTELAEIPVEISQPSAVDETPRKSKLERRRSLSRLVLEHNTFSKVTETTTTEQELISSKIAEAEASDSTPKTTSEPTKCSLETGDESKIDLSDASFSYRSVNVAFIQTPEDSIEEIVREENVEKEVSGTRESSGSLDKLEKNVFDEEDYEDTNDKIKCDRKTDTVIIDDDVETTNFDVYEGLSNDNNYGNTDPQMNVFEISDDLDLNKGMCVGENATILEIDTNYGSTNDGEVFADDCEVLSNVIAINESSSVDLNNSNSNICERHIEDLKDEEHNESQDVNTGDVEIIEIGSSDEESDHRSGPSLRNEEWTEGSNGDDDVEDSFDSSSSKSSRAAENHRYREELSESYSSGISENSDNAGSSVNSSSSDSEEQDRGRMSDELSTSNESSDSRYGGRLDTILEEWSDVSSEYIDDVDVRLGDSSALKKKPKSKKLKQVIPTRRTVKISSMAVKDNLDKSDLITSRTTLNETDVLNKQVYLKTPDSTAERAHEKSKSVTDEENLKQSETSRSTLNETDVLNKQVYLKTPDSTAERAHEKSKSVTDEENLKQSETSRSTLNETDVLNKQVYLKTPDSTAERAHEKSKSVTDEENLKQSETSRSTLNEIDLLNDAVLMETESIIGKADIHEQVESMIVEENTVEQTETSQSTLNEMDVLNDAVFMETPESIASMTNVEEQSAVVTDQENVMKQSQIVDDKLISLESGKSSQLISDVIQASKEEERTRTPVRRSTRLSSLQLTPSSDQSMVKKRNRRSASISNIPPNSNPLNPEPSTSKTTLTNVELPLRQLRSRVSGFVNVLSSPNVDSPSQRKRSLSIDVETYFEKGISAHGDRESKENRKILNTRSRRATSVTSDLSMTIQSLEVPKKDSKKTAKSFNESEIKEKTEPQKYKKAKSLVADFGNKNAIEQYSFTRRITRRQASLLEKNARRSQYILDSGLKASAEDIKFVTMDNIEKDLNLTEIDPIILLDKKSFDGKTDSDEERTIQHSPLSSIPESPVGSQSARMLRSQSSLSNISPKSETSTSPLPETNKKKPAKRAIFANRIKSTDETSSRTSVKEHPSPPKLKKSRRISKEFDSGSDISTISSTKSLVEIQPAKRTRTRCLSETLEKKTEVPLRRSVRKASSVKSQLPNIIEEQNILEDEKTKRSKKTLRKGSSTK